MTTNQQQRLIYYPGFEVRDINWLKFALLYLDEISPIVPPSGDVYLSSLYQRLIDETDLVSLYRPHGDVQRWASSAAIHAVEDVLRNESIYERLFGGPGYVARWENSDHHTHVLFEEKYTWDWREFCKARRLATDDARGMMVAEDLSHLFMTALTQSIADVENCSSITDHRELDRLYVFFRRPDSTSDDAIQLAQLVVGLKLPADIGDISFDKIIKFRNKQGFKKKLRAFHDRLNRFYATAGGALPERDFVESTKRYDADFDSEVLELGAIRDQALPLALSVWVNATYPANNQINILKDVVVPSVPMMMAGFKVVRQLWAGINRGHACRQYLADLGRL